MRKLILGTLLLMVPGGVFAQVPKPAGTPVLISSDEECRLNVDGEDLGTVPAGGIKKIELAPGEHLVSAVCPGDRRWKSTVTVGSEQKIVSIPSREAAPAAAAQGASPEGRGYSGIIEVRKGENGRWLVASVLQGTPAHKAGIHPGSTLISVNGRKARDLTLDQLVNLDEGGIGTVTTVEILDRDDRVQQLQITRAAMPASGTMDALQADGNIKQTPYPPDAQAGNTPGKPELGDPGLMADRDGTQFKVYALRPGSSAEQLAVPKGSVIIAIDGTLVRDPPSMQLGGPLGSSVVVTLQHKGQMRQWTLTRNIPLTLIAAGGALPARAGPSKLAAILTEAAAGLAPPPTDPYCFTCTTTRVTREGLNLYKDLTTGKIIQTTSCLEYAFNNWSVLKYQAYAFDNKLTFSSGTTCAVTNVR